MLYSEAFSTVSKAVAAATERENKATAEWLTQASARLEERNASLVDAMSAVCLRITNVERAAGDLPLDAITLAAARSHAAHELGCSLASASEAASSIAAESAAQVDYIERATTTSNTSSSFADQRQRAVDAQSGAIETASRIAAICADHGAQLHILPPAVVGRIIAGLHQVSDPHSTEPPPAMLQPCAPLQLMSAPPGSPPGFAERRFPATPAPPVASSKPATTPATPASARNYKTELCLHWEARQRCRHGANCAFAHSPEELRVVNPSTSVRRGGRPPRTTPSAGSQRHRSSSPSPPVRRGGRLHFGATSSPAEAQLQRREDTASLCSICLAATRSVLLLPCRHLALCSSRACNASLGEPRTCPLCHGLVTETQRVI